MTHYKFPRRLLALVLTLVMVVGMVPNLTLGATAVGVDEKTADPSTMNSWTKYFGTASETFDRELSSEYAGAVWTDKSVFADKAAIDAAFSDTAGYNATIRNALTISENNFLVALSALSSRLIVSGQSATPTDTMLVLDLSNSMDTLGAIPTMVEAINDVIAKLLSQNIYSRVGVVLYSGNDSQGNSGTDTATVLLPLDRYTAGTWNGNSAYIRYSGSTNNTFVYVADGVKNSSGTTVSGNKQTNGATYIQNGLYKAWQQFNAVTDTKTPATGIQASQQRQPIIILMSDGQPTAATDSFNNIGTSNRGNGTDPGNGESAQKLGFVTQLTAAWVKAKVQAKYNNTAPKFYTVGLQTSSNRVANAVLNPAVTANGNTTYMASYWNEYLKGTANQNGYVDVDSSWSRWNLYKDPLITATNYVDQHWSADDIEQFKAAFQAIADRISLDSGNYPTFVSSQDPDLDGYVTFADELGEFMEVKNVKGMIMGTAFFSGAELAAGLTEENLGTTENPSPMGDEFIRTVKERIGITDTSVAQQLVDNAFRAGQLSTNPVSNYIGWYESANGEYMGFWQESDGYTSTDAPLGTAKYINKSYSYLGAARDSNMMHVVVKVSTEIATGNQTVYYQIPAALIPQVQYQVELNGTDVSSVKSLTRTTSMPLQLVFEVGLDSELNAVNLEEKIEAAVATGHHHVHKDANGNYEFYTNRWGNGDGSHEIDHADPTSHQVASSHFHPALDNSRYYYVRDTALCSDTNGTKYTGTSAPSGNVYYFARSYYTEDGLKTEYLPVSAASVAEAAAYGRKDDGCWYIPAGTPIQEYSRQQFLKNPNSTDTLNYAFFPIVVVDTSDTASADDYDVHTYLGNNGRLVVSPAVGIKISKTVTQTVENAPANDGFEFVVTLHADIAQNALAYRNADGSVWTGTVAYDAAGTNETKLTLKLKNGEEVYILDIPANTAYTVKETQTVYYNSDKANDTVSGTVISGITNVDFTNSPRKASELTITKTVIHPFPARPDALNSITFTIQVDLGSTAANRQFTLADGRTVNADANGVITLTMKAAESVIITGLLEDTPYKVTEINLPDGFTLDATNSANVNTQLTLQPGNNNVHVVNNYTIDGPISPAITVTGQKIVDGDEYNGIEIFTFLLEKYMGVSEEYPTGYKTIGTATAQAGGTYTITLQEEYTTVGTHTYRITEVSGSSAGMTYDASQGLFVVTVTDNDMDGQLEYTVSNYANTTITGDTVTKNYTNTYSTTSTHVDINIHKTLNNDTGVQIPLDIFHFGLYDANGAPVGNQVTTNAVGEATIRIPLEEAGTFTYTLKEIAGTMAGMDYDDTEYTVTVVVEDVNSQLVATVTTDKNTTNTTNIISASFENTYDLTGTSATLVGDKDYYRSYDNSPITLQGGEFTFQLWTASPDFTAGTLLDETTNAADGSFSFDAIDYSQVGGYYYIIREVPGDKSYVTYDSRDVLVLVNVTADGADLKATVAYREMGSTQNANLAQFRNVYNVSGSVSVPLSGTKTLNGKSLIGGQFTFGLYDASGNQVGELVTNAAGGGYSFPDLTFDTIGTYTYTVKEVPPAGAVLNSATGKYEYQGTAYDNTVYTVTIEVKDNGEGGLTYTKTVSNSSATVNAPDFTNDYTAKPTTVSISGTKTITGKALAADMFQFQLQEYTDATYATTAGAALTVKNDVDGKFTFNLGSFSTTGTHYYIASEVDAGQTGMHYDVTKFYVVVQITDAGIGQLGHSVKITVPGTSASAIAFSNLYHPVPTALVLSGNKTLNGRDIIPGEFSFQLFETDASWGINASPLQTKPNNGGDGKSFTFDSIAYEEVGTYYYVVKEMIPSGAAAENDYTYRGVKYDLTEYRVTVVVEDVNGTLVATPTYATTAGTANGLSFTNDYAATGSAILPISGTKIYKDSEGNTMDMPTGTSAFRFTLYKSDLNWNKGIQVGTVHAKQNGSFDFMIPLTELGDNYFILEENKPLNGQTLNGITYDQAAYHISVIVEDDGVGGKVVKNGSLSIERVENSTATATNNIVFTNTYSAEDTNATVFGSKRLIGRTMKAGEFNFQLFEADVNGNINATQSAGFPKEATNGAAGSFSFVDLTYTYADAGKTFTYVVKEKVPAGAVLNSETNMYEYQGVTYDNRELNVTVSVTDNGDGTLSTSVSYPDGAITFRNSYEVADLDFDLSGTKTLYSEVTKTNMTMDAGDFTFILKDKNGNELKRVSNAADGSFLFQDIKLEGIRQHTFYVEELEGTKGGVTYSKQVYTVTVMTYDNGDGTMHAGAPHIVLDGAVSELNFLNTYNVSGTASTQIYGSKSFNKYLQGGEFSFQLLDENKNPVGDPVTNDVLGGFCLPIEGLDTIKTYTFYVVESIPAGAQNNIFEGIQYDPAEYKITVKVVDNGDGTLKAETPEIANNNIVSILFTNSYSIRNTTSVDISGTKALSGKNLAADMFEFRLLDENGQPVGATVKNDANGNFVFEDVPLTEAKTYRFTVEEIVPAGGLKDGITYDQRKYDVAVEVTDDGKGNLVAGEPVVTLNGAPASLHFLNTYAVDDEVRIPLSGNKVYTKTLTGGEFSFGLYDAVGNLVGDLVTNDANGDFRFPELVYTEDDLNHTYSYTIKEHIPAGAQKDQNNVFVLDGVTYDSNEYILKITVRDNGDGKLNISKQINNVAVNTIDSATVKFDNKYNITGVGLLELTGTKELTGKKLTDGAYSFGLYDANGDLVDSFKNDADGNIAITVEYDKDDISAVPYVYTLKEIVPANADGNTDYDETVYELHVTVSDSGKGTVDVTCDLVDATEILFKNTYTPDAVYVNLNIQKTVKSESEKTIAPEGFEFVLTQNGTKLAAEQSDKDGKAGFAVKFDGQHIGQEFTFQISEAKGKQAGVTYDKTVHTVTVKVEQNEDGTLKTLVNGKEANSVSVDFVNTYEDPVTPITGDSFNMTLVISMMVLSLLGIVTTVATRKKKESA